MLIFLDDVDLHVKMRLIYWNDLSGRIEETLSLQGLIGEEWDKTVVSLASEIKLELLVLVNKIRKFTALRIIFMHIILIFTLCIF